jgi:hypothetical protein
LKEQTDDLSARDVVDVLHSACKLEVTTTHSPHRSMCLFFKQTDFSGK